MGYYHDHEDHHRENLELWIIAIQGFLLFASETLAFCKGNKKGVVQGLIKIITSDCFSTLGTIPIAELPNDALEVMTANIPV